MKPHIAPLALLAALATTAQAQVWISEVLPNPVGSDSSATFGNEYFELRGSPNLSLSGYFLLSLEGQGTTGRGDVNQFFDLGAFSLGANGYLFARQNFSPYTTTAAGASVIQNTTGQGWGQVNGAGSTVGHSSDGTQLDFENSATTILLVNKGSGSDPTLSLDLDSNDDGTLDLPAGWTVVDSVGIMDGVGGAATDFSYGAITFRVGGLGTSAYGNIIDVPGTGSAFYVGRKGASTGSTADDWFGAILTGSSSDPLNMTLSSTSDPLYQGLKLPDLVFGGPSPVPEPGTLSLLGLGGLVYLLRRRVA